MRNIFFILLLGIVVFRVISSLSNPLEGKHIRLTGTLLTDPKEYGTSLLVNLNNYTFFLPQNPVFSYGARIVVEGVVFNRDLKSPVLVSATPSTSVLSWVRSKILMTIRNTLPEPESSLLAGATIGAPNIPALFSDALQRTGTSHIVVASGGNLAILAGFLEGILSKFLKRKIFLPLIALVLILYSALTGFGAPIVRALIMWLAIMLAQLMGRPTKQLWCLIGTILVMLFLKPIWIMDVSFWLSIGSTVGIVVLASKIQTRIKKLPLISEAISTSVAAQIGILPVSIVVFHDVNILSPLWNALVLWTVPYITIIGMIGSVATLFFVPLGKIIFLTSYPFCWYFVKIVGSTNI